MSDVTVVYTDGACLGNPGPGGWAWAVVSGEHASGGEPATTNQRMEITAAFEAIKSLPGKLQIVSDSMYVIKNFRDRWYEGWIARGWKNTARKPVANRDLWEPFINLYLERGGADEIQFRWVKGHAGEEMNEFVDQLAVAAAAEIAATF
jgi:ribonuclease HI